MLEEIIENYYEEEFIVVDGFDEAVIGVDESTMRLIYSVAKVLEILQRDEMNLEEALEFFNYNTVRAGEYMGERRPIWCQDFV